MLVLLEKQSPLWIRIPECNGHNQKTEKNRMDDSTSTFFKDIRLYAVKQILGFDEITNKMLKLRKKSDSSRTKLSLSSSLSLSLTASLQ